ncbi:MAG: hypothetical protein PHG85_05255 [Candidatus Altiarchaeota archaeon]|nr:hypothetical protein [Candidatus Altiarchaeota archaeon]
MAMLSASGIKGSADAYAPLLDPDEIAATDDGRNLFTRVWLSREGACGVKSLVVAHFGYARELLSDGNIYGRMEAGQFSMQAGGDDFKAGVVGIELKCNEHLELEAVLLDRDSTMSGRMESLRKLMGLVRSGKIAPPAGIQESNNHIHTWASFSPYSPAAAAWASYLNGLEVTGKIDHDTVAGNFEFLEAARICDTKATSGMELRTNASDDNFLKNLVWNYPGMPNVIYFLAHAIPGNRHREFQREIADGIMEAKDSRNRVMMEGGAFFGLYGGRKQVIRSDGVNGLLGEVCLQFRVDYEKIKIGYDRDIVPLTFREGDNKRNTGNATDRHLMIALARKINASVPGERKADFVEALFGRALTEKEKTKLSNEEDFKDVLRDGLLKPKDKAPNSVLIKPDERECSSIREVSAKIKKLGGIPVYAYLGDKTCDEDNNLEEIVKYLAKNGVEGIAIMPHRNTPEQIRRVSELAEKYDLLIISGVDINRAEQPLIHHRATAAEYPGFRVAANAMIGHERLSLFGDCGFCSGAIGDFMPKKRERLAFLSEVGRLKGFTGGTLDILRGKKPEDVLKLVSEGIKALGNGAKLEDIELGL